MKNRSNILLGILGVFLLGAIASCIATAPPTKPAVINRPEPQPRSNEEVVELQRKVRDLEAKLRRDSETSGRRVRKGECEDDRSCERMCDDIYRKDRRGRRDCQDMSIAVVERLKDVFEALEDGDLDELEGIDPDDLDLLASVSVAPLEDVISDYGRREAKDMASWLAENPDIVNIFVKEEGDYELFEALFKEIDSDILEAISENIAGSDSFIELAAYNNDVALEWVHGYLEDRECAGADQDELCVLSKYCGLLDKDTKEELIRTDIFEDFFNSLIDDAGDGEIKVSSTESSTKKEKYYGNVKCPVTDEYIEDEACEEVSDDAKIEEFFKKDNSACTDTADAFTGGGVIACEKSNYWNDIEDVDDVDEDWDNICK